MDASDLIALTTSEPAELERAVREHGRAMLAVARRLLGNDEDARECLQKTYLSAYAKAATFEDRSAYHTWLHQIVVNTALGMLRKRKQRGTPSIDGLLPEFDGNGCRIEPCGRSKSHSKNRWSGEMCAARSAPRSICYRICTEPSR